MKARNMVQKYGTKVAVVSTLVIGSVSSAFAALPAVVGTTLTTVQEDGLALADLMWPVIGALFGAMLIIKLFKRFGNKI